MKTKRPEYIGIKLSKEENQAIIRLANRKGLTKSSYARSLLIDQLIAQGAMTVYNPAPQDDAVIG